MPSQKSFRWQQWVPLAFGSLRQIRSGPQHSPWQHVRSAGQQYPSQQRKLEGQHRSPHFDQRSGDGVSAQQRVSVANSMQTSSAEQAGLQLATQRSPSRTRGGMQGTTHSPISHTFPSARQLRPQAPQLLESTIRQVHRPKQQSGACSLQRASRHPPGAAARSSQQTSRP
jgi:hypothetical protein